MGSMRKIKKLLKNKKGFSLVELVICLVIIGILTSIALPALSGYIDEANQKASIMEARNYYAALQTTASLNFDRNVNYVSNETLTDTGWAKAATLMGMIDSNGQLQTDLLKTKISGLSIMNGSVTAFTYNTEDSNSVQFKNNTFTYVNNAP